MPLSWGWQGLWGIPGQGSGAVERPPGIGLELAAVTGVSSHSLESPEPGLSFGACEPKQCQQLLLEPEQQEGLRRLEFLFLLSLEYVYRTVI